MPYYELFGEEREAVQAEYNRAKQDRRRLNKLLRQHGAKQYCIMQFTANVVGFVFETPPDPTVWKKARGCLNTYSPRAGSKAGRELRKQLSQLYELRPLRIADIIGMNVFQTGRWATPGCWLRGKRVFVEVPEGCELTVGRRLSDVTYERLTKKAVKSRK